MNYSLRTYQQEMVDIGVHNLQNSSAPFILQAATGAGKSLVIAAICHRLNEPVLILQPSRELLLQNYEKMKSFGIDDVMMYSASVNQKDIGMFTMATIGSIHNKPELFRHFKYAIIDEAHGLNPKNIKGMYTKFFRETGIKKVCGLTATPYRIDQKYIQENGSLYYTASILMINRIAPFFFKKIAYKIETAELIEQGYLSPIDYFIDNADISSLKVNSTGADFTTESLERYWNNDRLRRIAQAVQYSDSHNERSLIFCSSLLQANRACELAQALVGRCAVVDGKTPMKERTAMLGDFKMGKIKHIFNVGVLTTGFDMPVLDCIILARPTLSLALYYQMVGRGVRIDTSRPEKRLKIYDLVGVVERLGRVESIRVQTEAGGFRDEVWSESGRMDNTALFKFFVKNKELKK